MGKWVKKVISILIFILAFLLLDLFARFVFSQNWFSEIGLSKEVDGFNIISLIISSIVTIIVGWYITKVVTEQRYQKEFLLSDLLKIDKELENLQGILETRYVSLSEIIICLNKIERNKNRYKTTISIAGMKRLSTIRLDNLHIDLYAVLTNCDGEYLTLNEINQNGIDDGIDNFISQVRQQIIMINKY